MENVLFKSVKYSFQLIQSSFTLGNTLNKINELQNLQDNINELEPKERIAMTAEEAEEKDVLLHNKIRFGYLVITITALVYFITKY